MDIKCYRLIAGDILRYSNGCLIECYSERNGFYYSSEKFVGEFVFQKELSIRLRSQEISNATFEKLKNKVTNILKAHELNIKKANCFEIPGGSTSLFSNGAFIQSIKKGSRTCEITQYTLENVIYESLLGAHVNQYIIDLFDFKSVKGEVRNILDAKIRGLENKVSSKTQIEIF